MIVNSIYFLIRRFLYQYKVRKFIVFADIWTKDDSLKGAWAVKSTKFDIAILQYYKFRLDVYVPFSGIIVLQMLSSKRASQNVGVMHPYWFVYILSLHYKEEISPCFKLDVFWTPSVLEGVLSNWPCLWSECLFVCQSVFEYLRDRSLVSSEILHDVEVQ